MRAQSLIEGRTSASRARESTVRVRGVSTQHFVDRSPGLSRERNDLFVGLLMRRRQLRLVCVQIADRRRRDIRKAWAT